MADSDLSGSSTVVQEKYVPAQKLLDQNRKLHEEVGAWEHASAS